MKRRNKKSRLDRYKTEIKSLIDKGVSVRSAWSIINSELDQADKITYSGFFYYVKTKLNDD